MLSELYAKWMFAWETALTTRDTNRIVRPLEWGFDWLRDVDSYSENPDNLDPFHRMLALNKRVIGHSEEFFNYQTPSDFRLETRHPSLFPTNVRPETVMLDAELRTQAKAGNIDKAQFLRFTSPIKSNYPENDTVNARWYPATSKNTILGRKQALIVLPQWNADSFSHNALCELLNRFGVSALRLSTPYHDVRRPEELVRSDYAVSANVGRTIASCRQAVLDIRSCLDWLELQGYQELGILGTSLGSCYAFIAAAHDARLKICAFNHASTSFGDVVWSGQSTRHVRSAFEQAGLAQQQVREVFDAISPRSYMRAFGSKPKRILVIHATYDLTFPLQFSLDVLSSFDRYKVNYISKVLPCGHYTMGEIPYKFIDGWYLITFFLRSFRQLSETSITENLLSRVDSQSKSRHLSFE